MNLFQASLNLLWKKQRLWFSLRRYCFANHSGLQRRWVCHGFLQLIQLTNLKRKTTTWLRHLQASVAQKCFSTHQVTKPLLFYQVKLLSEHGISHFVLVFSWVYKSQTATILLLTKDICSSKRWRCCFDTGLTFSTNWPQRSSRTKIETPSKWLSCHFVSWHDLS